MKTRKIFAVVLAALMLLSVLTFGVGAADGIAKNDNVVFVADGGNDENAGTADAPVATLAKAFEKLASTGGVAVVEGVVTITAENNIMPKNEKMITITSNYDGVDYSAKTYGADKVTARIVFMNKTKALSFAGDVTMDYLVYCIPQGYANTIIAANYNDLIIGEHCKTVYEDADGNEWYDGSFGQDSTARTYTPIILSGMDFDGGVVVGDFEGGQTITEDFVLSVGSGDWQSVRVGDRDAIPRNTLDCHVTFNVSGGRYTYFTGNYVQSNSNLCVMAIYQCNTTEKAVIDLNVTGGTFFGEIAGFGAFGGAGIGQDSYEKGTINMNITGGTFAREYNMDGNYIVPSIWGNGMSAGLTVLEPPACVNIFLDSEKIKLDPVEAIAILSNAGDFPVNVHITKYLGEDILYVEEDMASVKYDSGAPAETDTPTTTEAPTTTAAPTSTAAPTTTTKAPAGSEDAPTSTAAPTTTKAPTGGDEPAESSFNIVPVIIAVAAVIVVAVVVAIVVKKKKA